LRLAKDVVGGKVRLIESEIRQLTSTFTDLYDSKPNVVKTSADDTVYVGDLHGDYQSALAIRNLFMKSPDQSLVFLGDYADRGPRQIETFNLVMSMAIQYPERILMLRGNHESNKVARMYGFFDVVRAQYTMDLFNAFCDVFKSLPLAGISKNGVFSCHGGIPEGVDTLDQIQSVERRSVDLDNPVVYQLAWNDPVDGDFHFSSNRRGGGTRTFGRFAFDEFVKRMKIKLMIRAHEVFSDGYRRFFGGRLISVFSTAYSGRANPKVVRVRDDLIPEIIPI
jgi:serine/threonine-protein phosphatase PP1 catalytic subunit